MYSDKLDGVSAQWKRKRRRDDSEERVREEQEEEANLIQLTELAAARGPRDRKRVSDNFVHHTACTLAVWLVLFLLLDLFCHCVQGGEGREVGSSRICKFHTSHWPVQSLLHHFGDGHLF